MLSIYYPFQVGIWTSVAVPATTLLLRYHWEPRRQVYRIGTPAGVLKNLR